MDKMPSLSTIKRVTRTINQLLGTKYSPTQIYKNEVAAREYGRTTRDFQTVINLPRTRTDVKRPPDAEALQEYGEQFLKLNYAELSYESALIQRTLNAQPGDYFTATGELIQRDGDGWKITRLNLAGRPGQANRPEVTRHVKNLPAGAVPATPAAKEKIIKEYAKQIKDANKFRPGSGYDADVEGVELF